MKKQNFLNDELRELVKNQLCDTIFDAIYNDRDICRGIVESGFEGVEYMNDETLMNEYAMWHGCYDVDDPDDIDDHLYKQMLLAQNSQIAEKVLLEDKHDEDDEIIGDQCADSYVGLLNNDD